MMMVNLGTLAVATAVTSLAPWRAMPSFSYLRPTMKPVMFCRNTSGILRWQHSSMKCAPFRADSLNRMPLLAMMPTSHPLDARKAADQGGAVARLELVELAAIDDAGDDLAHVKRLARVGRDHAIQLFCFKFSGAAGA